MKTTGVTLEYIKILADSLPKLEKDFGYLQNPAKLPRAYEKTIIEVSRRKRFRKIADE
jgi:hypothetical protein